MKIKLWGVRGSITTTGAETACYGGNTTCVDVWEDGCQLVLDGGSGIHKLIISNPVTTKRIDILLTHLHLDHIQGLGFFTPLFDPSMEVHLWGPAGSTRTLHSRLSRYLSPPLFPVLIRDLPCKLILHEIGNHTFKIGHFTIQSNYIIHPGPTVGYRVSGKNSVFAFMPDHEPALGKVGIIRESKWISGIDIARDADLLLHDAQYTQGEYESKKGWGHSSMEDAALFASMAGVKHLLFAHHDPSRTDDQLNEIFAAFQKNTHYPFVCQLSREGMEITLK
ncbi:MBL fold metallo-hydrolase [Ferruginibacter sp.]|uniref:MBL fold metallo-hydrolase n=1 Tax=Ferruginibacter sp. TaxID=1940288 RepID=UPI0019B1EA00|nr:MBL fold metallo-hydrolase [Ferruginibacter sp.]MBC7629762.1 MBL fold metallo-hydrolase [Ferruginibacter sp.]